MVRFAMGLGSSRRHGRECSMCSRYGRYHCNHDLVTDIDGGAIILEELTAAGEYLGKIGNLTHGTVPCLLAM